MRNEFQKFLLLDDIRDCHPADEPYVVIARSSRKKEKINQPQGEVEDYIGIRAFLVPKEQKNQVLGKFSHEEFSYAGQSYFEDNGRYVTGETFEDNGVNFEIIVNNRTFDGLNLDYYEPTDRMVTYLKLHQNGKNWINPYTNEDIIKTGGTTMDWEPHETYLCVRKSELIDYLAARRCGLLLLKYSGRLLKTPVELIGLPEPFDAKQTKYGRQSLGINKSLSNRKNYEYFSRLWESFWIDPASHPRRWDAKLTQEFENGISFMRSNGEMTTYKQGGDQYFELLSFNPSLIKNFLSQPHNRIEFFGLTILNLYYADGFCLQGCINREGQFQTFFGLVAELDYLKQQRLTSFSEPQKAEPSYEYIQTNIHAQWPETREFNWTLFNCLREVNSPWEKKFGETLFLSPAEDKIPSIILIGPVSHEFYELADIMLELRKSVINDSEIENIKKNLNYSSFDSSINYEKIKSIGFTRLLFGVNGSDRMEHESYILKVIDDLRNCKGHPKDVEKVLKKFSIPATLPRTSFLYIMAEFCGFLLAFKTLTEKVLGVTVETPRQEEIENPWLQLQIARKYFQKSHTNNRYTSTS